MLTAIQDLLVEGSETVIVDINTVTNATEFGTQSQTVTITDDDICGDTVVNPGEQCDDGNTTA